MLDVVVRVRSSYFELDSSKYRLGISRETLLASLRHQHDKNFKIVLDISPMDPFYSKRREAFDSCGVPCQIAVDTILQRRIEIFVDDDDFLHPGFVVACRQKPEQKKNTAMMFPNGYVFKDGIISPMNWQPHVVRANQIVDPDDPVIHNNCVLTNSPCWIHVRHMMNQTPLILTQAEQSEILLWTGWNPAVVEKLADIKIKTATANGAKNLARRSNSVILSRGARGRRRSPG